jgi:hypothetical protein
VESDRWVIFPDDGAGEKALGVGPSLMDAWEDAARKIRSTAP